MQREPTSEKEFSTRCRPRLLMLAYSFAPSGTMEERNGWQRAILAARQLDVTVAYFPVSTIDELKLRIPESLPDGALDFMPIEDNWLSKKLKKFDLGFYLSYRLWHWKAYQTANRIHAINPFDASHLVTLCGFREPGYINKLDIPHIWGPLGGTHDFPKGFLSSIDTRNQIRETIRSAINSYQLKWSPRVRRAVRRSAAVIASTTSAHSDLKSGFGISTKIELETGLDHAIPASRMARNPDQPLKILWAGRLREWKGLPILLHAIAELPNTLSVQVRILGDGSSKGNWIKLANKLGVEKSIEWIPWSKYSETLQYYKWADVFAFTSLRDTSGTGLLEALAAGCPILGLNHQGAMDIMTEECAIRVSVADWFTAVSGFRDGIIRLAEDADEWLRLSHVASLRAKDYDWNNRQTCFESIYRGLVVREGQR